MKSKFICGTDVVLLLLITFDLFGIAALVVAIDNRVTPPLLIVGYMVTTIGGILYGTLLLLQGWTKVMDILYGRKSDYYGATRGTISEIDGMLKGMFPIPTSIDLMGQGITDKDCEVIARLLKQNNTIKELSLRNNNITDVQSIGEGLKTNNTLTHLYLSRNNITDDGGIQSIIDGLKTNNTLYWLKLYNNQLSDNMKSQLNAIQQYKRSGSNGYQQVEGMYIIA